jgi:hypothetical protein
MRIPDLPPMSDLVAVALGGDIFSTNYPKWGIVISPLHASVRYIPQILMPVVPILACEPHSGCSQGEGVASW